MPLDPAAPMTERDRVWRRLDSLTRAASGLAQAAAGAADRLAAIEACAEALDRAEEPEWSALPDPPTSRALAATWSRQGPEPARARAARAVEAARTELSRREAEAAATEALRADAERELVALDAVQA